MKLTLKDVRISFPHLFEVNEKSSKFDATFIFSKDSAVKAQLEEAIEKAGSEKWGAKWGSTKKGLAASNKLVIHDGDVKADKYAGYEGNLYFNASNKVRPAVKDRQLNNIAESDGVIYAGCRVNAVVDVYALENAFGKFVSASLLGVQFVGHAEAFTSSSKAVDSDFEELTDGADAEDLV